MVTKVNGKVASGEFLGRDLDFYTLTMNLSALTSPAIVAAMMEKVVQTIALNGQPIMIGTVPTSNTTTETLKFAIEHKASWQDGETLLSADKAGTTLDTALEALLGAGTVSITKSQTLS